MASRREVWIGATVVVEIKDPDVIERITGPGGDEWRSRFYDLHTEADVIEHLARNCAVNGVDRVRHLEGWADLPDEAATMWVDLGTFDADVQPPSSTTNGGEDARG
jgi:hypothetical protein